MTHLKTTISTKIFVLFFIFIFSIGCNGSNSDTPSTELYIWSHNDYEQETPLFNALSLGSQMIEADIHLIGEQIYVNHDHPEYFEDTPLLERLYIQPLKHIISENEGKVLPESSLPFYLIIDIKTEAESTYEALITLLEPYNELFHRKEGGKWIDGPIRLLISGNRPLLVAESDNRIGLLDGRISDIGKGYSSELYPLISDNWNNYFMWDGIGEIPDDELDMLHEFVSSVHQENKMIRFWATPDNENLWEILIESGVDVINVDDLEGIRKFLDISYPTIER